MFLEIIATVAAGFGGAGIALALRWASGGRVPGWLTPLFAGAAMVVVIMASEYSWYDRQVANLPEGLEVADINEVRQIYRPWTYLAPLVNRFVAVDVGTRQAHEATPDLYIADLYTWGRWAPINKFPVLVDCAGSRRALLPSGVTYEPDGTVEGAIWASVPDDDPVLTTACKRG